MWAHDYWQLEEHGLSPPDIMTFAKKLQTAGYFAMPHMRPKEGYRIFNTWMGDPCKVLLFKAVVKTIKEENLLDRVKSCGVKLTMAQHGLQAATRAKDDGADEELIVCALLHDIGELFQPISHGELAASWLRPYISPQNYWVLEHHEIFQSHYYQHAMNMPKDVRDAFKDYPYFQACCDFCEKYDAPAFDPTYETLPLSYFEPMVHRVFAKPAYWHPDWKKDPICAAKLACASAYPTAE